MRLLQYKDLDLKRVKPAFAKVKDSAELGQKIYRGGIADKGVTSLERETGVGVPMRELHERVVHHFAELYEADVTWHEGAPELARQQAAARS